MSCRYNVDGNGNFETLRHPSFSGKMQHGIKKMRKCIQKITESVSEEEKDPLYFFPEQLSTLSGRTGFSKNEIRRLYRNFKQYCPRGAVTTNDLRLVYTKLFPLGDSSKYMQIVFNTFDRDGDGLVSFSDLLAEIALIVKGSVDEKLSWIFGFYDLDGDGCISKHEMLIIVSAIYEMVQQSRTIQYAVNQHVDKLFEKMDVDKDGVISKEEFMISCKNDSIIHNQLGMFSNFWW